LRIDTQRQNKSLVVACLVDVECLLVEDRVAYLNDGRQDIVEDRHVGRLFVDLVSEDVDDFDVETRAKDVAIRE